MDGDSTATSSVPSFSGATADDDAGSGGASGGSGASGRKGRAVGLLSIRTKDGERADLVGLDVTANSPVSAETSHTFRPSALERRKQILKCKMLR